MATTLETLLDERTRPGELFERLGDRKLRCFACGHRCVIFEGQRGICKIRFNREGTLHVPHGYVASLQADPTEKKPFFHVLPGSLTLTFGMLGCDYHCPYCQNWLTSQTLRDSEAGVAPMDLSAEDMVAVARRHGAQVVGSSYNEPLITAEWAVDVFRIAREEGLRTVFVSNGNATREALRFLRRWTDGYKVDLKSMHQESYRQLGGVLSHVLDTIGWVHELGFWEEIVTLVVPGFNDSDEELREAAEFLVSVSPEIPWHVTAFHKDYKMTEPDNTPARILLRAAEIGTAAGLHYVYAGNLPGQAGRWENTYCPDCGALLIERFGYQILRDRLSGSGICPVCDRSIPGIWS